MAGRKVVIIGGGLAGLAAANVLCKEGKGGFEVILLEANNIVGGRIQTIKFPDGTLVPAGATYFHGTEGNSVYLHYIRESKKRRGGKEAFIANDDDMSTLYAFSNGGHLPDIVAEDIEDYYDDCLEKDNIIKWSKNESDKSMKEYLQDTLLPFIQSMLEKYDINDVDPVGLFQGFLSIEGISEGSKYVQDISTQTYINWNWLDGGKSAFVEDNPFQLVVESLVESLPNDVIHVNNKVELVEWNTDDIRVKCTNGLTYTADHVIVTVSLGVLKSCAHKSFFNPPLPLGKVKAIDSLGYGLVNKIICQFDGPLFDKKYCALRLNWSKEDKEREIVQCNPWLSGLHEIDYYPTVSSNIYIAWLSDEDALAIENLSSVVLKDVLETVLKLFLGNSIPDLLNVQTTYWSNEYTCGSYSYTPLSCPFSLREELSVPVGDLKLLFAGEATCCSQYSCAHPAYDSGCREASRLLEKYKK